ncbi:MAG: S4 domain-containing protein YaaA [Alicyclobacillaceae bacterium]|nr:S4 domain-containing protein YaaA [Alicyclobacillaceae bacterium]
MQEKEVVVTNGFITLGQLLKRMRVVPTGGAAKSYLEENAVFVNGERETRRGRKLYPGDVVTCPEAGSWRIRGD